MPEVSTVHYSDHNTVVDRFGLYHQTRTQAIGYGYSAMSLRVNYGMHAWLKQQYAIMHLYIKLVLTDACTTHKAWMANVQMCTI